MKTTNIKNQNAETPHSGHEQIELDSELERFCDFMGFDSEARRDLLQSITRIKAGPPSDPWVAAKFVEIIDTKYFQSGSVDIERFCSASLGWKADTMERNAEICISVVEAAKTCAQGDSAPVEIDIAPSTLKTDAELEVPQTGAHPGTPCGLKQMDAGPCSSLKDNKITVQPATNRHGAPARASDIEPAVSPQAGTPPTSEREERALGYLAEQPNATNRRLAVLLRMSTRGTEALLRRLRDRGLIVVSGKGRARRITPVLEAKHHTRCGEQVETEPHIPCGVEVTDQRRKPESSTEFYLARFQFYENCFEAGNFLAAEAHLKSIRQRFTEAVELTEHDRSEWIAAISEAEDRCFAFALGAEAAKKLSWKDQRALAETLGRATPEKFALIRAYAERRALACTPQKLLRLAQNGEPAVER